MNERIVESWVSEFALLLLGAAVIGILARRARVPYAVALVLGGLAIEEAHLFVVPSLDPTIVLFAFLPPLLFDASFRLDARELWMVARPVFLLALPGVLVTAVLVGGVLAWMLGLPLVIGLLFGSIVAATDPVAVIAIVKQTALPPHLVVIPEAESLINDGVAITLYTAFLGLAVGGGVDLGGTLLELGIQVAGGVAIGAGLGFIGSRFGALIDDHLIEMMISTVLAYGSYLVADSLHASGALACVAAGFVHGTYGRQIGMSAETDRLLDDLWEYLGFVANALLFLLVGFTVDLGALADHAWQVGVALLAVVGARLVVVESVGLAMRRALPTIEPGERLVLIWAGLRGALTMTLALGLPAAIPDRGLLVDMAFGVVLFTLVGFGLTLPLLIRWLGIGAGTSEG